jgi:hypothetical protein
MPCSRQQGKSATVPAAVNPVKFQELKIQIPIYWLLEFWFCGFVNGIETCATDLPLAEWEGLNHTDKSEDLPFYATLF